MYSPGSGYFLWPFLPHSYFFHFMIKYDRGHKKIWGRQFQSGRFILYSPKRGISATKMVITDYLIETHSFFECPLQKLRLYDDIEIFYRYIPNKRIICYWICYNRKKTVKNSWFFPAFSHFQKWSFLFFWTSYHKMRVLMISKTDRSIYLSYKTRFGDLTYVLPVQCLFSWPYPQKSADMCLHQFLIRNFSKSL